MTEGKKDTKIKCVDAGEESVGICAGEATLEVNLKIESKEIRETIRNEFIDFCKDVFDFQSSDAWFSDECPDCHKIKDNKGNCRNRWCVSGILYPYPAFRTEKSRKRKTDKELIGYKCKFCEKLCEPEERVKHRDETGHNDFEIIDREYFEKEISLKDIKVLNAQAKKESNGEFNTWEHYRLLEGYRIEDPIGKEIQRFVIASRKTTEKRCLEEVSNAKAEFNILEKYIFDALNSARAAINSSSSCSNKEKVSYGNTVLDLIESIVDFDKIKQNRLGVQE